MVNWFAFVSYLVFTFGITLSTGLIGRNKRNPYRCMACGFIILLYGMFTSIFLSIILETPFENLDLTPTWIGICGFAVLGLLQIYELTRKKGDEKNGS